MFEDCDLKITTDITTRKSCPFCGINNKGKKFCGIARPENEISRMEKCPLPDMKKNKGSKQ